MKTRLIVSLILCAATLSLSAREIPSDAIVVAQDGSGQFTTIQEAVNSVRSFTPVARTIFIKKGVYREKVCIETWHTSITLVGEDRDATVISWDDYNGKADNGTAYWSASYADLVDKRSPNRNGTFLSGTLMVMGNDITVEDLTIENTAGRVGQALAIHVEGDRVIFRNCRLLGNQDTVYLGREGSRNYFKDCYITGTTDFIFGPSTAVFSGCTIHCLANSYITAASTPEQVPFGFVFLDCDITADASCNRVLLGRPWRAYGATAFLRCRMGAFIAPAGWNNWSSAENEKTARYAEYANTGEGAVTDGRVAWAHRLTDAEAKNYTLENIFAGSGGVWLPE